MRIVLGIATVLGVAGVVESFGLFYLGERVFHMSREMIQTLMYLKLSVAGRLTIFVTRTRGPFWSIRPARLLLGAVMGTQIIATLISVYGLFMTPIGWNWALLVCIPFDEDTVHAAYDADAAQRFWRVLLAAHDVMAHFRTGFLGKSSPVHFFWGSFDLAVTRFSGRRAPPHPGGVPHLPDAVVREAYSHEVSSAGFWPGGGAIDYPAFYSYAYPAPEGFAAAKVKPAAAFFSRELGEFLLPYDAVRNSGDPDATLLDFLQSTYAAAADVAKWDRQALECALGENGRPRAL